MSGKHPNGKADPTVARILAKRHALNPQEPQSSAAPFNGPVHLHIHGLVIELGGVQMPPAEVTVQVDPAHVEVSPADRTVSFMRDDMGRIQAATVKETKHEKLAAQAKGPRRDEIARSASRVTFDL
jgi:hypothetical protein